MTVASWPETLPQRYQVQGAQLGTGDGRLRSQTDTGPGKTRPRFSAVADPLTVSMKMTEAQWLALQDFVKTTLAGGSLPFTIPKPLTSGGTWLVRFADSLPSATPSDRARYLVTLPLEILP